MIKRYLFLLCMLAIGWLTYIEPARCAIEQPVQRRDTPPPPPPSVQRYQIEIVVLTRLSPADLNSEQWQSIDKPLEVDPDVMRLQTMDDDATDDTQNTELQTDSLNPSVEKAPSLNSATEKATLPNYTLLPASMSLLTEALTRLKKAQYRIVADWSWIQPISDEPQSVYLQFPPAVLPTPNPLTQPSAIAPLQDQQYVPLSVQAVLTVRVKRYIDTHFKMALAIPVTWVKKYAKQQYLNTDEQTQNVVYFHVDQQRRSRSRLLNYIDHPLYGILFMITPISST